MSRAKAQAEVNLARDVTNTERAFYRCLGRERQAKASAYPEANVKGELASPGGEKVEVRNEFFASVFSGSQDSCISHVPEPCTPQPLGGDWGSESHPPHWKGRASPRLPHETGSVLWGRMACIPGF